MYVVYTIYIKYYSIHVYLVYSINVVGSNMWFEFDISTTCPCLQALSLSDELGVSKTVLHSHQVVAFFAAGDDERGEGALTQV
jgi:hypothetical protein